MPATRIDLPANFSSNTLIPVRITDLNYGNHVGNDSILSLIHEARIQFLRHLGYLSEVDIDGIGLIMSNVAIEFKKELGYGDQIKAFVASGEPSRASFELFYRLERQLSSGSLVAVIAQTGMVCYDYKLKKIAAIPPAFREKLIAGR